MIAIVDYGMGNLRSVEKALQHLGYAAEVTSEPARIRASDRVILPGVGAFPAAMANLRASLDGREPLAGVVLETIGSGKPLLGICLGMQLLLEESEEQGVHRGLAQIPGRVVRFDLPPGGAPKIPHMGWNELSFPRPHPLFAGIEPGSRVYFVHSYHCVPADCSVSIAECEHGIPFCAALGRGGIVATQFHPEKSGAVGLRLLDNFARWRPEAAW